MTSSRKKEIKQHIKLLKSYNHKDEFKREVIRDLISYWKNELKNKQQKAKQ